MTAVDLYATLGVERGATVEEIQRVYRKKAMKLHPDRGGNVEEFRAVALAYEVLSDKEKRARYDATGETEERADLVLSLVCEYVMQTLHVAVMTGDSLDHFDLLGSVRLSINQAINEIDAERKKAEKQIEKLRAAAQRVTRKKPKRKAGVRKKGEPVQEDSSSSENPLAKMILAPVANYEQIVKVGGEKVEAMRKALKFLEDYEYKFEKQVVQAMDFSFLGTTNNGKTNMWFGKPQ